MKTITLTTTKQREIVDVTEFVNAALKKLNKKSGICHIFLMHTTAAVTTVYIDPESELSIIDTFEAMMPMSIPGAEREYLHKHFKEHIPDHIIASFIGTSLCLPVKRGQLLLGKYQRVALIELNGLRERTILVN
ncbi:MAG: secondary thiamine-phosphate synthase enzyme YjbQ [Candidatus Levybacteria bacterium]|nr:secondary thiamine-phosphate synthase enzyme YjbQ [Candidatus Levybacteria bacterium]